MMRRPLLAANWKMHGSRAEARSYATDLASWLGANPAAAEVVICPPAAFLVDMAEAANGFAIGAQDCHAEKSGAFTGEHSSEMLKDAGCRYVIVGHSERRQYHRETDAEVRAKAMAAMRAGLEPIVCIGETLEQRQRGETQAVLAGQLVNSVPPLTFGANLTIAYEPVWAIGTGLTPTSDDLLAAHDWIHRQLKEHFGEAGQNVRVLYGGSVKPENAAEILAAPGVDGVLVGGASLKVESMAAIIASLRK